MEVEYEVSSYQVPAELSLAYQPCSAQQRSAVRCRAVPRRAVRCCAMLRAVLYLLFRACQVSCEGIIRSIIPGTRYLYTRFVRNTSLNHKCPPSSAQLSYDIAQQRSGAVPCCAVACPAVRCLYRAAPCCALSCIYSSCAFFHT